MEVNKITDDLERRLRKNDLFQEPRISKNLLKGHKFTHHPSKEEQALKECFEMHSWRGAPSNKIDTR